MPKSGVRRHVKGKLLACAGRDKDTGFSMPTVEAMKALCSVIIQYHPSFDGYEIHDKGSDEILASFYASDVKEPKKK